MYFFVLAILFFAQSAIAHDPPITFGTPVSSTLVVSFPKNSTRFQPNPQQTAYLTDANQATLIIIRGRTSTNQASVKDDELALNRALAARTYLILNGVSPLKILVNFAPATDFVAENSTPEGNLQNQRVEIELVFVPVFTNEYGLTNDNGI